MRKTGVKAGSDPAVRVLRTLAALTALGWSLTATAEFRQDQFVIGFWGDPPVDGQVNARYAEVADAGFNIVMGGLGATSPALAQRQRDACNRVNIRVLFATYGLPVNALCNCATTYGFLIRDHPSLTELDMVRARVEEVRRERPDKLPFINLAPPSTPPEKLGAPDYETYLNRILETLRPEVLCWDELPWALPGNDGPQRYENALCRLREAALRQGGSVLDLRTGHGLRNGLCSHIGGYSMAGLHGAGLRSKRHSVLRLRDTCKRSQNAGERSDRS